MNAILRVLLLVFIMFVGNVHSQQTLESLVNSVENIVNADVQKFVTPVVTLAVGIKLKEQLDKQNAVAKIVVASTLGGLVGGAQGGLSAGAVSAGLSGLDYCLSKDIKKSVSHMLPESFTSEDAKTTVQILLAAMVGYYCGNKSKK